MIGRIAKILKVLNSETEPGQISLALCFAMVVGLTPLFSLHNFLVLLLVLFLRINLSTFIVGWVVFSGVAYILDPIFHRLGLAILTAPALEGLWTSIYNIMIFRFSKFYNSIVMGSVLTSLIFFLPVYFLSNMLIKRYREHVLAWVRKTRLVQVLKGSKLFQAYETVSGWRA